MLALAGYVVLDTKVIRFWFVRCIQGCLCTVYITSKLCACLGF